MYGHLKCSLKVQYGFSFIVNDYWSSNARLVVVLIWLAIDQLIYIGSLFSFLSFVIRWNDFICIDENQNVMMSKNNSLAIQRRAVKPAFCSTISIIVTRFICFMQNVNTIQVSHYWVYLVIQHPYCKHNTNWTIYLHFRMYRNAVLFITNRPLIFGGQ